MSGAGKSGGTAAFPGSRGARRGRTSSGTLTLHCPPHTRPPCPLPEAGSQELPHFSARRCPPGALETCRALTTRGALNAGLCYPRFARIPAPAAPPRRFPLSRLRRARLPTPRVPSCPVPAPCSYPAPVSSSPRPLAAPRGPGSHPSCCFPLGAPALRGSHVAAPKPTHGRGRWVVGVGVQRGPPAALGEFG